MTQFDFEQIAPMVRYEILLSTIAPRPVAIITTLAEDGSVNAAPYSLINVLCHDPPILAFGVLPHAEQRFKDTAENVLRSGQFVVNMVSEELAAAMNVTCIDAPRGVDELQLAGLSTEHSQKVAPPRIAGAPAAFECTLVTSMSFAPHQSIVLGRVVHATIPSHHVLDAARGTIDTPALQLVGAMHGARWYARSSDLFAMDRPTWAQWVTSGNPAGRD